MRATLQKLLGDVAVGAEVENRHSGGPWYAGKVIQTFDWPDPNTIHVAYHDWAQKYSEWIGDADRVRKAGGAEEVVLERAQQVAASTSSASIVNGEVLWVAVHLPGKSQALRVQWAQWEGTPRDFPSSSSSRAAPVSGEAPRTLQSLSPPWQAL